MSNGGKIHVSLVAAKSRAAPLKPVTMPRLELTAAKVSAKMSAMLLHELDIGKIISTFWTDSQIVLGYILNETNHFRTFVANRVKTIRGRRGAVVKRVEDISTIVLVNI